jgi:hypothetical protein
MVALISFSQSYFGSATGLEVKNKVAVDGKLSGKNPKTLFL